MARGITQEDVFRACDALLIAGERPTIERVRLHLGSGSPNTVGPHLDSWFKGLGARIVDPAAFAMQAAIPDAVQQAAKYLWEHALAQTRADFDARLQEGLAAAVANVEAEKERARIADVAAFKASGRAARLQVDLDGALGALEQEKLARVAVQAQHDQVQSRVAEMQEQAERQRLLLQRAQEDFSADLGRAREAAATAEIRSDAAARRALQEIDRARQALLQSERQREALQAELLRSTDRHRAVELEQTRLSTLLQERLDAAATREADLQQQLEGSRQTSAALQAQAETLRDAVARLSTAMQEPVAASPRARRAGAVSAARAARSAMTRTFKKTA